MRNNPRHFTITDPRTFDGTPYEVAGRAIRQTAGLLALAADSIGPVRAMVLNAEMSRQQALGAEPDPSNSVQERQLVDIANRLTDLQHKLEVIERAAIYDPKHPPRA